MKPYYQDDFVTLYHADCLEVIEKLPDNSVDAIVTDPPYGLGFMGKKWDNMPPGREWAEACLRVLKPGGHMLAFGGARTWHRLAVAIEDAGFEIRDTIAWVYGEGFPKSMDVSKAIDKHLGVERVVTREGRREYAEGEITWDKRVSIERERRDTPATEEAAQWKGWGTNLKPAFEPVILTRKPFTGTVAENVLEHGVGALNIDATRIPGQWTTWQVQQGKDLPPGTSSEHTVGWNNGFVGSQHPNGRHPANLIFDEYAASKLDEQSGHLKSGALKPYKYRHRDASSYRFEFTTVDGEYEANEGGASRFFYCAKARKSERPVVNGVGHPTVKPLALMEHLVQLITPPGGVLLDPFAGSGTTLEAATRLGFKSIGVELDEAYLPLIEHRLKRVTPTQEGLNLWGGDA